MGIVQKKQVTKKEEKKIERSKDKKRKSDEDMSAPKIAELDHRPIQLNIDNQRLEPEPV